MRKHKYGAKRTEVDGVKFDSRKEANRYMTLKLLERDGYIADLKRQVKFELNEGGTFSYKYILDFQYIDTETGLWIYEDVKGVLTTEFKKKMKLMKSVHGITIKLT